MSGVFWSCKRRIVAKGKVNKMKVGAYTIHHDLETVALTKDGK